jgi:prepilin-type N-terminal cleavage/methylation domain-containing protein
MKKKAFTLVELLVVISIIAMLLAILLPSLQKARDNAKATVCKSNMKQISLATALYLENNNQNFFIGANSWVITSGISSKNNWMTLLKPYYNDFAILQCPMAIKGNPGQNIVQDITYYSDEAPVRMADGTWKNTFVSYGINNWTLTPQPEDNLVAGVKKLYWNGFKTLKGGRDGIPVFMDAACRAGNPKWSDTPPDRRGKDWREGGDTIDQMRRFCLDRHSKSVNATFADMSVKKVQIKGLWYLKWYNGYPVQFTEPRWPKWMN